MAGLLKIASKLAKTTAEMAHELAQKRAALPTAKGGLGLPKNNTSEQRAEAQNYVDYYHGTQRLDRLLSKSLLDPKRATSGPMPYGTTTKGLASSYATKKADTSRIAKDDGDIRNYFQVLPKDLGVSGRLPMSVERSWNFLSPEQKESVRKFAPRVGYENLDEFSGPLIVHPEGVNATISPSQWDYFMKTEAKGNPLTALRQMWHDSGQLYNNEEELAKIYNLAGYKFPISQENAPWTEAKGVLLGKARTENPINTSDNEYLKSIVPTLRDAFKRDRTQLKYGPDQWGKESRYTPKSWVNELEKDLSEGNESYVWTSIPDKVTEELKKLGHDSILDVSGKGGGSKEPVVIPFDPSQVRSRFAAFDPFRKSEAIAAAMGVAAPDLMAAEPDKKAAGGLSKAASLIKRVGEAASKAKPFYSAVDEAIAKITQGKGTGEQFLSMIKKTPGVKPKEIKDRGLDKLLTGKMTKAEVEKIAADNPPPQIFETTKRGPEEGNKYRAEYDPDSQRWEVMDDYSMPVARFVDEEDAIERAAKLNDSGTAKFADTEYVTKGGTNHREILFRMPSDVPKKESALRSWHEQMKQKYKTIGWKELATTEEVSKNNALVAALKKDQNAFKSQHYDEPNILAHARVSDRIGPNGEKILHVDEIQSDLHQKARDARKKEIKRLVKNGMTEDDAKKAVPSDFGYSGNIKELPEGYKLEEFISPSGARAFRVNDPQGTLYSSGMSPESATKNAIENLNVGVPDAPFKSDWHELVMKRLLDDAARNGYDRVTITPGAEQAKRYGLSKQVDQLLYKKNPDGTYQLSAQARGQGHMLGEALNEAELESQVGKDVAQRIIENSGKEINLGGAGSASQPKDMWGSLSGLDLNLGGEGMIGFYDQMLPAFVNRYGEKTGLRMNLGNTPVDGKKYKVYEDSNPLPFSIVPEDGFTIAGRYATQEEADRAALAMGTQPHHSIDITPEFRESVTEKGQPFYQIGAGSAIGAAAASEEEPKQSSNIATFRKGGEVNLDAMRMAVLNKQLRKRHG